MKKPDFAVNRLFTSCAPQKQEKHNKSG